ncbi:hypothetical protein Peur_052443 [Populus x canadensis]
MITTHNEKYKGKHFTWSKHIMSHMLLAILAEEPKHVDNHLKTVKKEWGIITKLKNKSGSGWDDCLKMITVSKDVYNEEVKYLNKKLDMYEAMTIVVGKDMATRNYTK